MGWTGETAVRDEGPGIAPQNIPRLTERFYRVDVGREPRPRAAPGLGLALGKAYSRLPPRPAWGLRLDAGARRDLHPPSRPLHEEVTSAGASISRPRRRRLCSRKKILFAPHSLNRRDLPRRGSSYETETSPRRRVRAPSWKCHPAVVKLHRAEAQTPRHQDPLRAQFNLLGEVWHVQSSLPPFRPRSSPGSSAPPRSTFAADISGAGATFPYPVYSKWADTYKKDTGIGLNYQSIGSGGGVKQIVARTVTFGASDAPMKAEDLEKNGLVQWPQGHGRHRDGRQSGRRQAGRDRHRRADPRQDLSWARSKTWNDPALVKLNPGAEAS